jgi:MFS family permease
MSGERLSEPPPDHVPPLHAVRPAVPPHPDDAAGFARVLRRRDFRFLWGAQCGSQLAQNFIQFALLVVVYDLTGLTTAVAAVAVAFTFPGVLLSAPAGVYADRHDKRSLMMLTNLLRAVLLVLIPVTQLIPFLQHQAWPLLIITFLFSSVGQVFAPAEAASIPSLVSREQIQGAMSLFMTTVIFTLMLGSVLAPVCLILFGDLVPFYIAAGLFALAALSCWRIRAPLRAVGKGTGSQSHVLQEFQDGIGILRRGPALRWGMIQLGLALVMVFTIYALGAPYLQKVLHRSPNDISIVLVPAMVGLVAMAGVLGQHLITLSRRALSVLAFITTGTCLALMGILPPVFQHLGISGLLLPAVVFLALAFGCALGAILIPSFTVLQEGTTEESRGRIFGGVFTVINASIALPLLAFGGAVDLFHSVTGVVDVFGALVIFAGLSFRFIFWSRLTVLDHPAPADATSPGSTSSP